MAMFSGKNGKAHVLEISNRASIQTINIDAVTSINTRIDNHIGILNTNAHEIQNIFGLQDALDEKSPIVHVHEITDITGLQTVLNEKQDTISGANGSFTYVKTVNFVGQSVTNGTIVVENGIITSIS